jgi:hypothetical protein
MIGHGFPSGNNALEQHSDEPALAAAMRVLERVKGIEPSS